MAPFPPSPPGEKMGERRRIGRGGEQKQKLSAAARFCIISKNCNSSNRSNSQQQHSKGASRYSAACTGGFSASVWMPKIGTKILSHHVEAVHAHGYLVIGVQSKHA